MSFGALASSSSPRSTMSSTMTSARNSGIISMQNNNNNNNQQGWGNTSSYTGFLASQTSLLPFVNFYQNEPKPGEASFTMDEIFRLASRRMTLLHTLQEKQDQLAYTSNDASGLSTGAADAGGMGTGSTSADTHTDRTSHLVSGLLGYNSLKGMLDHSKPRLSPDVAYENTIKPNMEDYVSHWACRLAFCQDARWTEWFVKNEKILFREKLRLIFISMKEGSGSGGGGRLSTSSINSASSPSNNNNMMMLSSSSPSGNNNNDSESYAEIASASVSNSHFGLFLNLFPSSKAELLTRNFLDDEFTSGCLFDFLCLMPPFSQRYALNPKDRETGRLVFIKKAVHEDLFTVPFTAVKDLVKRRRAFVHKGRAIIQAGDLIDYITQQFTDCIRRATRLANQTRRSILEDVPSADASSSPKATLLAMLDSVFKNCVVNPAMDIQATIESNQGEAITLGDMQKPALAQQHMPPCMLNMDQTLRVHGHLKHNGRFQYSLFLKAAGLKMLDSLRFFAETMTQKGGGLDNFTKSAYGYGIRHVYGKEGKHTDYSSLNCPTLINGPTPNPAADRADCFGCPFKTQSEGELRRSLGAKRIGRSQPTPADIEEIISDKRGNHYTRACRRYFTAIHEGTLTKDGQLFRSPLEFFSESRAFDQAEREEKEGTSSSTNGKNDNKDEKNATGGDRRDRTGDDNNNNTTSAQ